MHTHRQTIAIVEEKSFKILDLPCTLSCEYLREFSKKIEMALMVLSGPWGKLIHVENMK